MSNNTYAVVDEKGKLVVFSTDRTKVLNTIHFLPKLSSYKILELEDKDIEQSKNGVYYLSGFVDAVKESSDEKKQEVLLLRDAALKNTDYMMMPDYPIDDDTKEKIKNYRQEWRDITKKRGFPYVKLPKSPV
jgi:hypothetical protein